MLAPSVAAPAAAVAAARLPITVQNLTVAYAGRPAIRDVTWNAPPSGLVAVVGPNGAGKSTLLKAILGLVPKASGEVLIHGEPVEARRGDIAYVPQRSAVDWDFPASAADVVAMGLYRRIGWLKPVRRADREEARRHLATVGLADYADRQIGALSGGQQQRVFIARALAQRAKVYLLDEPFAGVDAVTERIMVDIFNRLRAEGALVVCVQHDLAAVRSVFDHVLLISGRVVAAGPTAAAFTPEMLARTYGLPVEPGGALADDIV